MFVLLAVIGIPSALVVVWGNGERQKPSLHSSAMARQASGPAAVGTAPVTTAASPVTATTIDPGDLPQTGAFPSASSQVFLAGMSALWEAVTSGIPERGQPAFFPEAAYNQLKAVRNPPADWTGRLLGSYYLDIGAAHHLLGPDAASAQLLGVRVYPNTAHWVAPGVCYNRVGYFEVPNSRVVYQVGGQVRSFGIASMISWRGEWYVIHLGAVIEAPGVPTVDAPASGAGYPAHMYTC